MIIRVDRFRKLPIAVKASVAFFIGSIISKALAYITTPIYTRLMSSAEYGRAAVYYTWFSILGIFAMYSLSSGVFNNGMVDYPDKRDEYSLSMLVLSNLITIVFTIVLLIIYPIINEWVDLSYPLLSLMIISFISQPAYNFWLAKQRYEFKYKAPLVFTTLISIFTPLFGIIGIYLLPQNHLYGRLFGSEGFMIIICIGFMMYLARKGNYRINTSYWKPAFLFNLPLLPHYLSILILVGIDRIMISQMVGESQAAYYTVAFSVAIVLSVVWSAINSSLVPYTYEKCKVGDYKSVASLTNIVLLVFAIVCLVICLMAPELVKIMATEEYMEAIYIIPPVIAGIFFQVQYFIYANLVYYHKKTKYVMYASVISAGFKILLNYILIPTYGYLVAGYTTLFCYIIQAAIDYLAMRKVVGASIYNMKYIVSLSSAVVLVSLSVMVIYSFFFIRLFFIVILIAIAIIKRNYIKLILKKYRI